MIDQLRQERPVYRTGTDKPKSSVRSGTTRNFMANTYTQIYPHVVFAVEGRQSIIPREKKEELHKYITGIVQQNNHKMIIINGMPDHLHIVVGMRPTQSVADLLQDIKGGSSKWINDNMLVIGKFQWQEGYGAFSYSRSHVPAVIRYIQNQEAHHKKETFSDEYRRLLKAFEIDYEEQHIFKEPV